jgi:hypothetical protein
MANISNYKAVEAKIITIRKQRVLIDSDVAVLYGVETRRINEAVVNNPDKFPDGYIIEVEPDEKKELVENFDRFNPLKHSTVMPKAFTEKGLYMLATILKSPQATQTTIAIVETFAKIRELTRTINEVSKTTSKPKRDELMQKSGNIIADILDDGMEVSGTETSFEIDLAVMKFKHIVKKQPKEKSKERGREND